jgi:hypothetical protein
MRRVRGAAGAAALLAALAWTANAEAHGGRGRTYTATGPAAIIPAPATTYYGGFGVGSYAAPQPPAYYQAPAASYTAPGYHDARRPAWGGPRMVRYRYR